MRICERSKHPATCWLGVSLALCGCENSRQGLNTRSGGEEDAWAIRCITLQGPNRFRAASRYADGLRRVRGLDPELVQVFDENAQSSVYYGRYSRRYDARRNRDVYRPDPIVALNLIRQLSFPAPQGSSTPYAWPFQLATVDALPGPHSDIAQWELTKASGRYSLQIGVFYNTGEFRQRKRAAEEYCKLLRAERREAYYLHGPSMSIVTLGSFEENAIENVEEEDPLTGRLHVREKIVDEQFLELQRAYPNNLHNGSKFYNITRDSSGEKVRALHYSFAIIIPGSREHDDPFGG